MQSPPASDSPARTAHYTPDFDRAPAPRELTARLLPAVAVLVLLLSLIPVADLIPGGYPSDEWRLQVDEWLFGTAIVAGVATVAVILLRRAPRLWPVVAPGSLDARADRHWWPLTATIAVVALALYALVAWRVTGGTSILIDEMAQTIQAHIFASGRLTAPVPEPVEFFATQHMLYHDGRAFSQFPPGGPAAIAVGTLLGAEWLVGPAFASLSVLLWSLWLRRTDEPPATALLAVALFALCPFTMFISGTRMNHVMTTTLLLGASVALVTTTRSTRPRPLVGLLCGLCYGLAATFRPVDAAVFALPGGAWLLARALRDRTRIPELLLSGVGVATPLALTLWFNVRTTGEATLFGYQLLWGKAHDIGFHIAPWGLAHTPTRGLESIANYLLLLQRHFLETPIPGLLAVCGAFLLTRRTSAADRYLLAAAFLLLLAYWAYWHSGKFMGPRFLVPLTPLLALWTARFPRLLRARIADRTGSDPSGHPAWRAAVVAMLVAVAMGAAYATPIRWAQYAQTFGVFRWSPAEASGAAGVRNALVLVREGWESQLVVRMWSRGVSHPRAELYYRAIDACRLEMAIGQLERANADSTESIRRLDAMLPDSVGIVTLRLASGPNIRVREGATYGGRCSRRLRESEAGVVAFAPIVASLPDGNLYVRDLHARDTILVARFPDRPLWLLSAESADPKALPRFYRIDRDSLRRAWAEEVREDTGGELDAIRR